MNAIVIEHMRLDELPPDWRARLAVEPDVGGVARMTVRIEAEVEDTGNEPLSDDPLFGMWSDRADITDVAGYVRAIRAPRPSDADPPSNR